MQLDDRRCQPFLANVHLGHRDGGKIDYELIEIKSCAEAASGARDHAPTYEFVVAHEATDGSELSEGGLREGVQTAAAFEDHRDDAVRVRPVHGHRVDAGRGLLVTSSSLFLFASAFGRTTKDAIAPAHRDRRLGPTSPTASAVDRPTGSRDNWASRSSRRTPADREAAAACR